MTNDKTGPKKDLPEEALPTMGLVYDEMSFKHMILVNGVEGLEMTFTKRYQAMNGSPVSHARTLTATLTGDEAKTVLATLTMLQTVAEQKIAIMASAVATTPAQKSETAPGGEEKGGDNA